LRAAIVLKANQLIREPYRLFCFFIQIAFPELKPYPVYEVAARHAVRSSFRRRVLSL